MPEVRAGGRCESRGVGSTRGFCGDEIVLYLNCDDGYSSLHM